MRRVLEQIVTTLLLLSVLPAFAENSTQIPGHTIHHNAITTAFLSPEVASSYGIVRSKYRGLMNISIIKTAAGTTGTAVEADIQARWQNIIGKNQAIPLRKVTEGKAIYYIGEFPIVDGEKLHFFLDVKPDGVDRSYKAELSQEFYID